MSEITICMGMTETSPVSFQSHTDGAPAPRRAAAVPVGAAAHGDGGRPAHREAWLSSRGWLYLCVPAAREGSPSFPLAAPRALPRADGRPCGPPRVHRGPGAPVAGGQSGRPRQRPHRPARHGERRAGIEAARVLRAAGPCPVGAWPAFHRSPLALKPPRLPSTVCCTGGRAVCARLQRDAWLLGGRRLHGGRHRPGAHRNACPMWLLTVCTMHAACAALCRHNSRLWRCPAPAAPCRPAPPAHATPCC